VLEAQPTGYQQSFIQQPGQQPVQPQATGASTASKGGSSVKIPNGMVVALGYGYDFLGPLTTVRLSFLTAEDQKSYEQLFRSALSHGEQAMTGKYPNV
jgi:hypothetical protein